MIGHNRLSTKSLKIAVESFMLSTITKRGTYYLGETVAELLQSKYVQGRHLASRSISAVE